MRRIFKLGQDRVRERKTYDHVGVTCCLTDDDVTGIEGRLSKARRALNAISGMGIRRNGLSVATCCTIFWVIVAPIALFGAELWILNDRSIKLIEAFQTYAGKKVQRLFVRAPNTCAFFGLGWLRLERLIEVKKLLFARSILMLKEEEPSRRIFCTRVQEYLENPEEGKENVRGSIVFDLLNVADIFGFMNEIVNMAQAGHFWSKRVWREKVWKRAWALDDCYWRIQSRLHRSLDILSNICTGPNYTVWWQMADNNRMLLRCCETMMKIITHASLLRSDDVRLKGAPPAARFCILCDLSELDDVGHMVMSCPSLQPERESLFEEIRVIQDGSGQAFLSSGCDILMVLLGRPVDGLTAEQMLNIWTISVRHIAHMYNKKTKVGIG